MSYAVNYWGSHPDLGNDDCHSGEDFDTYDAAYEAFHARVSGRGARYVSHVELVGDDGTRFGNVRIVRANPDFNARAVARERAEDDRRSRREAATQAGMAFGCQGYNDAMGY